MTKKPRTGWELAPLPALLMALVAAIAAAFSIEAEAREGSYYVMAPVLHADPIMATREIEHPVEYCTDYEAEPRHNTWKDRRDKRRERRVVPSIIGGLIGGLVGSQFGGGSGRKVLTVLGALAGSSIANGVAQTRRHNKSYSTLHRSCHTTYETETSEYVDGYEVFYEYGGQEFSKIVRNHPGDEIRVHVELTPVTGE
jgi:uncharacterized protein YcfJ